MLCQIACLSVVQQVVEGCNDGGGAHVVEKMSKGLSGCWTSIERRVGRNSYQSPEGAR